MGLIKIALSNFRGDIMIWYIIVAIIAFVAGALVFRNNPAKGEVAAKILEAKLAEALAKAKTLEEQLSKK
jgi:hypothetical protein